MKIMEDTASQSAEVASNQASALERAATDAHRKQREIAEYAVDQQDQHNRSLLRQADKHNYNMEEAANRQAEAAEEMLRLSRKAEWARTHPIQPTKAKKIRKLANGKLIDNTTTLEEFNQIWDNTDAFWILLHAYQIANGNDKELNLNDMYIDQGDIQSAINLKRLIGERDILTAMVDGRWDYADQIRNSRDFTVLDKTTQQIRAEQVIYFAKIAADRVARDAAVVNAERIAQLTADWRAAERDSIKRNDTVVSIVYTVLFLMGCVFFAPWSADWWVFKAFGLFLLWGIGYSVIEPLFRQKPAVVAPDFKNITTAKGAQARLDAYKQSVPYVEDTLPGMPGTNIPAKERKEPLFK